MDRVHRNSALSQAAFFAACHAGDTTALRDLLAGQPDLVDRPNDQGLTGLHLAARHPEALRLLLAHGADPNARENGDNALPLHFAAGEGHLESVRVLLDAGSDVQGAGDLHQLDVIGWATVFAAPHRDVVELLVSRGARHHVFSAIAMGDDDALRQLVIKDPLALGRRLSRFEQEQSALHYVVAPADGLLGGTFRTGAHYRTLEVLIELGADLEARDAKGRTPLEVAMLRGDRDAMRRLHAAGARVPEPEGPVPGVAPATLAASTRGMRPMLHVTDMEATVAWYRSIGFTLSGSHAEGGRMDWAEVAFGAAAVMLVPGPPPAGISLWIETDRLDELYAVLRRRQLDCARAELAGHTPEQPATPFAVDLHHAFYGQREFGLRDPDGVDLFFCQPDTTPS